MIYDHVWVRTTSQCHAQHTAQHSENTLLIMASVATAARVNAECRRNNRHMESIPCYNKNGLEQTMGTRHFTSLHLLPHSKHINYVSTSSISSWMESNNEPKLYAYASNKSEVHSTIDHNFCKQDVASTCLKRLRNPQFHIYLWKFEFLISKNVLHQQNITDCYFVCLYRKMIYQKRKLPLAKCGINRIEMHTISKF